ncbi:MAG: hypothetical protein IKM00_10145 [Clostridia bacterium]|nr:hypothetical protein [Clostridia bacterium]MBR6745556.1 hypothetical protein [Clostridia bacterium]
MKRFLAIVLFVLMLTLLIGSAAVGIYAICDIRAEMEQLDNTPGTSGADYLGLMGAGWLYGGILFIASVIGGILSSACGKLLARKTPKAIASVSQALFVLIGFGSVLMFFAGAIL